MTDAPDPQTPGESAGSTANVGTGLSSEVPPITDEAEQAVRVRRKELRDWAEEAEHAMRGPIEAPSLWKAAGIAVSTSALFYGLSLIPAYAPKDAPSPSAWVVLPAISLFVAGIVLYVFTATVEKEAKRTGNDRIRLLAEKIRHADRRTPAVQNDDT
jgi:hypothetical protein